ncbi:hypothetical protein BDN72DRAFT_956174 [Pluteus cervinus]|uniref:Uncharacterized protein n=1 Tax=Pluteus cervinus TaxID=181527 RepID=A0ACD3B8B9_9AGAR|nr:hypothetical protein BDN72DRAFT_956174 [Pluteus cervinus]
MTEILPPELEHLIFSLAFKSDPDNNLHLQCVAKRVHQWLVPLIYEVVINHSDRDWPPSGFPPAKLPLLGQYVRHIFLQPTQDILISDIGTYLTFCRNLTNLALLNPSPLRDPGSNTPLPITELLGNLPYLTELTTHINIFPSPLSESVSQVLSRITHLDAVNGLYSWEDCKPLLLFPALTHLSVVYSTGYDLLYSILQNIPGLWVLLLWQGADDSTMVECDLKGFQDERVVYVECNFIGGWEMSARGMVGPWRFGEQVVARRRREGMTAGRKLKNNDSGSSQVL